MSRTPVQIDDDLHRRMTEQFTPRQMVELSNAVAWEHARARFNRALGIESDRFDV